MKHSYDFPPRTTIAYEVASRKCRYHQTNFTFEQAKKSSISQGAGTKESPIPAEAQAEVDPAPPAVPVHSFWATLAEVEVTVTCRARLQVRIHMLSTCTEYLWDSNLSRTLYNGVSYYVLCTILVLVVDRLL